MKAPQTRPTGAEIAANLRAFFAAAWSAAVEGTKLLLASSGLGIVIFGLIFGIICAIAF